MTHVVTGRCVDCRYTDCCTVCPVECFYEVKDLAMLVIDPDTCIDCELCVPECPINAVYPESELPECYADWTEKNAEIFEQGEVLSEKKDAFDGAFTLEELKAAEMAYGYFVEEPSKCGHHVNERRSLETGKKEIPQESELGKKRMNLETGKKEMREEGEDGLAGVEDFRVGDDGEL